MNLDMLGDQHVIQTKPEAVHPVVSLQYDRSRSCLENSSFAGLREKPYIKRAIDFIVSQNFQIAVNLKTALEQRSQQKKFITLHESDIAYRGKLDLSNDHISFFLFSTLMLGFLIEETPECREGLFLSRARWNKGLEWKKMKRQHASEQGKEVGDKALLDIEKVFNIFCLPLHEEEREEGFDREFLKPECLTWDQFNERIAGAKSLTLEEIDRLHKQSNLQYFSESK